MRSFAVTGKRVAATMVVVAAGAALIAAGCRAAAAHRVTRVSAAGHATTHATLQEAVDAAQPGDRIELAAGTFTASVTTRAAGSADAPIVIRGQGPAVTVLTANGRVVTLEHPWWRVEDLAIDGQYGADDTVRLSSPAAHAVLARVEVRRSSRDCIDIGATDNVAIEDALVHHCLNAAGGRTDAHGIVAGPARRLAIRDTTIHTFSGDAFQVDPGRSARGWDEVVITGCDVWLAPLPEATNGFAAGVTPGENGIDTKVHASGPRARLRISNTTFRGFRAGLITNMAALNLKERIDATIDAVTVSSSDIAFRMRGPESSGALVALSNVVIFDTTTAFRYEDDLQGARIWHATVGAGVARAFHPASSPASVLEVRNSLFLAGAVAREASHPSNLAVPASVFADTRRHDYRLVAGASPIDAVAPLAAVARDRLGITRPQGAAADAGAFEWCGNCPSPPGAMRLVAHARQR